MTLCVLTYIPIFIPDRKQKRQVQQQTAEMADGRDENTNNDVALATYIEELKAENALLKERNIHLRTVICNQNALAASPLRLQNRSKDKIQM